MKLFAHAFLGAVLAGAGLGATPGDAAEFPTRPVELLVPYNPGGGSGAMAEFIKQIVTTKQFLPQPVSTNYKPGASGQIGWAYVAGQRGNPHVITTVVSALLVAEIEGSNQVKVSDFTPLGLLALDTQMMAMRADAPYKSMAAMIEAAKAAPRSIRVGVTGATGADATCATMVEIGAGIRLNKIPFRSTGESKAAVLGGHVDLIVANPGDMLEHIKAGKVIPLGVFSSERFPFFPDVPTMREQGYADAVYNVWRGVMAPAGLKPGEEKALIALVRNITESSEWKEYAAKNFWTTQFIGGADFGRFLADERARLSSVLKVMAEAQTKTKQ